MYNFVINQNSNHQECEKVIGILEKKYSIKFPSVLKEYYLKYDNEAIKDCKINEDKVAIIAIVPINSSEEDSFEKIKEEYLNEIGIPKNMYPLASDRGGDLYCWDSETENIYYYCHEFIDEPNKVCDNIEEFFKLLDNSLEYMDEYNNYEVVTLKTALEKATEFVKNINNTYDIVSCIELDDAYVFTCMAESSEEEFKERKYGIEIINNKYYAVIHGGSSIEVSKITGKTTYFILPDKANFERLKNGKTINLFE